MQYATGKGITDASGHFSFLNVLIPESFFLKEEKTHLMVFRRLIHFLIYVSPMSCN